MSNNIKQTIKREYVNCAQSPVHFMKKYCKIQHPTKGKIKFDLFDFQENMLQDFKDHQYNIILKSRQLGISTLSAGYSLWLMLFHQDKNILVIAKDKDTAKNLVTKVRVMYDNLPSWLKTKIDEDNKLSLRFSNGSQIKAVSASPESGRSEALSLLILDEAAFIDSINTIWAAAQQTLATGGDCIALSTPNGVGNWFHKTWMGSEEKINRFNAIKLHWTDHPDRDDEWRNEQDIALGPTLAAQECDANFLTSGATVVDPQIIQWYKDNMVIEPVEKTGFDRNFWVWRQPDYTKDYIVVADVARGDGSDFSACQIFDVENVEQVAEYKGQLSTTEYGHFLIDVATRYNDAILVVENNNIGWATIQTIIDRGYKNLFYQSKDLQYVDVENQMQNKYRAEERNMVAGFSTTIKTRPLIIGKMEEFTREKMVKLYSSRLIDEMFVFIYNNSKPEAMIGYNDDLIIAYALTLWIRDGALRLRKDKDDLQRAMMGSILNHNGDLNTKPDTGFFTGGGFTNTDNPLEMTVGQEKEDLSWLL